MSSKSLTAALVLGALVLPALASAADNNRFYMSVDAGRSDARLSDAQMDKIIPVHPLGGVLLLSNRDRKDQGYGLHLGYQIDEHFAVEGGYVDMGTSSFNGMRVKGPCPAGSVCTLDIWAGPLVKADVKATAWEINLRGQQKLDERWAVYGKLGVADSRLKSHLRLDPDMFAAAGAVATDGGSRSETRTATLLGAGLSYAISNALSANMEWTRHNGVGQSSNIDLYSLGLSYHF